jgi:hypothetical protein
MVNNLRERPNLSFTDAMRTRWRLMVKRTTVTTLIVCIAIGTAVLIALTSIPAGDARFIGLRWCSPQSDV